METLTIFSFQGAVAPSYRNKYVIRRVYTFFQKYFAPKYACTVNLNAKLQPVKTKTTHYLLQAIFRL
ncbi:hypothetical protein BZZ01_20025 [Nostocales cyanobacterium HT-58-2]|nr:hypothetical protein BZZ01_20025 [Nostocales cyanobacterium HT-58-2]